MFLIDFSTYSFLNYIDGMSIIMNIGAIIQARLGSTRLPKKILMKINGISVLESLLNQLFYSKLLTKKIIATSTEQSDDALVEFLTANHVDYFRGSESDVLDRYYQCSKYYRIDTIVRISGDAPFIDPEIVDKTIQYFMNYNFDYVNNFNNKNRYPVGSEVEVFTFETLETVWKNAKKLSEREHVTPYIYNNPEKFMIGTLEYLNDLSHLHWTVDRSEDLEFVRAVYNRLNKKPILIDDILQLLKKEPHLLELNKKIDPHEGYKKSLEQDHSIDN